ncbi:MAG: hypothetical protein WAV31_00855 [Candidatus Moraniibacteriota bacterium]
MMKTKMKIFLSDLHIAPFKAEKFLTQKRNIIEMVIQFFAVFLQNKEKKLFEKMKKTIREEGISLGISNGDLMEASATERGLATERDLAMAKTVLSDLENDLGTKLKLNLGNHESGYILPLSTDEQGGISRASIRNFLCLAGRKELYYSFVAEGLKFIFVPYLFTEKEAKDFNIGRMKKSFMKKMRQDIKNSVEPVIIFIHDPDSLMDKNLLDVIRSNREKIKEILYGHYHSSVNLFFAKLMIKIFNTWWLIFPRIILDIIFWFFSGRSMRIVRELGKYFRSRKNIPKIIEELGAILIPAPTGMFGIGGGFLILEVFDDGNIKIEKYK